MRIVLVEDNEMLARGIVRSLTDAGHAVDWLADGTAADDFLAGEGADLAIVDINLPGLDGFDIVRALRRRGASIPVLMLTARGETHDRVAGLDAGADDYLVKPFEMAELSARVRALLRRQAPIAAAEETIGALRYDRTARRLYGHQGEIELRRRELALFEYLLEYAGRIASKERIADRIYGTGAEIETNAVELLVSRLRPKLAGNGVVIRTARGLGYMLDTRDPA